ncbi:MAG: Bro-N domain-containing protein [Paludibacteraceae bacterium]|nr:Bro-N domain-containing protein [Paludibacteraceae bacterium]
MKPITTTTENESLQLFQGAQIRYVWDEEKETYFFCVNDVIAVLTESVNPSDYLKKVKKRDEELSKGWGQIVTPLKISTEGGIQTMNCADVKGILRIIQSVPSKKAEPLKQWLAQLGQQRLNQLQDPELSIEQAIKDYRRLGYSEEWINQRIKTIEIRKGLTDEWKRGGMQEDRDYATLTDIISKAWSGMTTKQYKQHKGLRKENLRDNMTDVELMLNGLAEAAATALSKRENPKGFVENASVAHRGGTVAHVARERLEQELGESVISDQRAVNFTQPADELPFEEDK